MHVDPTSGADDDNPARVARRGQPMTPNARIAAAIGVLDEVLAGAPAEQALLRWSRSSRFAGSGDRAAVRDLVFDSLRRRRSRAVRGGGSDGRALMLGMAREEGIGPHTIFTGQGHDPAPLTAAEAGRGGVPDVADQTDLPDWVLSQISDALGDETAVFSRAMRDRAPLWLRVNPRRGSTEAALAALARDGVTAQPHADLPTALQVTAGGRRVARAGAYTDGMVELQDLSPQLACASLPLADGDRVLDYCAGGGGKALALAARARITVTAHDADPARMADLPARATRAGTPVQVAARPQGLFDLVVADVPCSGSGTWRRAPDAKWRLTPDRLDGLCALQDQILDEAAAYVRPGGRLAYMTCSVLAVENADRIAAFLTRRHDFAIRSQRLFLPPVESDGFFCALLERTP